MIISYNILIIVTKSGCFLHIYKDIMTTKGETLIVLPYITI